MVELYVKPDTDPKELATALSAGIAIRIHSVQGIHGEQARAWLDIDAPEQIGIVRQEREKKGERPKPGPSHPVLRLRRETPSPSEDE
ncbi:hypothetical protein JHC42_17145 [Pseudomonas sp. OA3]|nr:hypothetical protein [Pseudomonas sp. OA3]